MYRLVGAPSMSKYVPPGFVMSCHLVFLGNDFINCSKIFVRTSASQPVSCNKEAFLPIELVA